MRRTVSGCGGDLESGHVRQSSEVDHREVEAATTLAATDASSTHTHDPRAIAEPVVHRIGPATFAARREQVVLAMKAHSFLSPRDQRYVTAYRDRVTITELSEQLGVRDDTPRIGQTRALERFRKSFALLS